MGSPGPYSPAAVTIGRAASFTASRGGRTRGARVAPDPAEQPEDPGQHASTAGPSQQAAPAGPGQRGSAVLPGSSKAAAAAELLGRQAVDAAFAAVAAAARPGTAARPGPGRRPPSQQQAAPAPVPAVQHPDGAAAQAQPQHPPAMPEPTTSVEHSLAAAGGDTAQAAAGPSHPPARPSPRDPLTMPNTNRRTARSARGGAAADSLYERLKQLRPVEQQEALEEQEAYWEEDDLQERRMELQRRAQEEEMLERIKRRVAGQKVEVPQVLQRLRSMITPRTAAAAAAAAAAAEGDASLQSTPGSRRGSSRWPLPPAAATLAASSGQQHAAAGMAAVPEASMAEGDQALEVQGDPWWPKVQRAAEQLTTHPDFQLAVMLVILLNCIALALYRPSLPLDTGWNARLKPIDIAVNVLFTLEMVLMVLAAGGPLEYLRGPWNAFDFVMVLAGYTAFIPMGGSSSNAGAVRALRALRALRPLRTIARFESLRSIIVCFLEAVPTLASVIGLLYFFMLLFAIAATVLFQDAAYFACVDSSSGDMLAETATGEMWGCGAEACPSNMTCQESPMRPPLQTAGFGNIGLSLLSMFQVATLTDWAYQLYLVMDRAGPWPLIFYIVYILLQCYFVVNLFLAVLKHRFATASSLYSKAVTSHGKPRSTLALAWQALRARFRRHMATQRGLFEERMSQRSSRSASARSPGSKEQAKAAPSTAAAPAAAAPAAGKAVSGIPAAAAAAPDGPPPGCWPKVGYYWFEFRWRVRQVIDHPGFGSLFMLLIIANTVLLAMTTAGMSDARRAALDEVSSAFTWIFLAETLLKLLGLGAAGFFSDGMNAFDSAVVALSLVDTFASMGANGNALRSLRTLRILRSFRVLRVLKIFRYLDSLRIIAEVLMSSMSQFLAVALLMVLFIFVFSLIGLQVFGQQSVALGSTMPSFLGFWNSFVAVFQILTLENWPDVMFQLQSVAGWPSVLFFVAWVTVGKYIILTLFLAITLAAFEQSYAQVTRTSTGSSMRRALNSLLAFVQGVTACCSCCGRLRRRRTADDADLASARWKSSGQAEGVLDDGALPELSEAAAKQAAAALSAAMSAKLAAAAGLGGGTVPAAAKAPLGTGSKSPAAQPSLPLRPAGQQQLPEDSLIKAGPLVAPATSGAAAADGQPAAAAADQPDEVHKLSHVDSLVQYFERLSPSKAQHAHTEQQQSAGGPAAGLAPAADSLEHLAQAAAAQVPAAGPLAGGSSLSDSSSHEPAGAAEAEAAAAAAAASGSSTATGADGRPRPLPRRTESRRAFLRAISRHARFAGVPEGDEEGSTCGSGAADEPADSLESSSPAASPGAALLTGKQPGSAVLANTKNTSTGRPTVSSRLQRGSGVQGGSYDAQVAAELQDADGASDFSGISGNSSVSSHFSRLLGHARRRSRRRDYPPLRGTSLNLFKVDNPVRGALYHLLTAQAMDYFLMLLVLLSCVEMAMETSNMNPAARRTHVLHWIDVGTTIAFALEALLKIVAFGFRPYIAFNSNKLDLVVVVVSVVVLIAESANARFLKALRVLRATRPLRVLTRSQSMLMVFHTLIRSLAEMANVTVLAGMVFLIFSILGVQLFAGLLWSCNDDTVAGKSDCVGTFVDPATGDVLQREWTNAFYNFDNVGKAFLTLFVTATLDGYTRTMYATMASRRSLPDVQPKAGSNQAAFLYWFAFITLCSLFVLNLYVGVVFFQYQRLKLLSETGSAVLTASQTGYVEMLRAVFRLKPIDRAPVPENCVRSWLHALAYNKWFDRFMLLTILLNIVLTATSFYGEPAGFIRAQEVANTAFSAFVLVELGVKLAAMGPRLYWRSNWHKLDVLLSVASAADIITQIVNAAAHTTVNLGMIKKVMMLARVLRMFRLLRHLRGVQMLLSTLIVSLPALWNVGALLFLLFFIFAYMGVLLFGQVAWQEDLNAHANFTTFPDALLLLFRVATGDNWAALLKDCMVQPPECDASAGNCGHAWAPVYFLSFYLSGAMIALNLLTTVILETFERIQDTAAWALTPQHLEDFCGLWAEYDDGTNAIDPKDLEQLLRRLPPPMGLGARATESDVMRFVFSLDIPLNDQGLVPFHRTAYELVVRCTEAEIPEGELKRKLDRMIRRFLTRHTPAQQSEHMNFQVAITVMRIQRHWRAVAARRRAEREAKRPVVPPLRLDNIRR